MSEIIESSAVEDWVRIQALFPTRLALIPSAAWLHGVSTRLNGKRLKHLLGGVSVGPLAAILDQCDDARIKALRTFAAINLEQAAAAFRLTMIANVSAPILMLSVAHQLIDGGLGRFLANIHENDPTKIAAMIFGGVVASVMLLTVTFYALASLNQARDIRHLIDLLAAERGIYFGLEDIDELHSP